MLYAIDWSHKEENYRVYNGKKITTKPPEPTSDLIIATENMPLKQALPFLKAGAKVFRCSTNQTEKYRKILGVEKTHDNDVKIIRSLYEHKPDQFYEMKYDPIFNEFQSLYTAFKDIQHVRVANGNRLWASPDSKVLKELDEAYAEREKWTLREMEKRLKTMPIWTEFLSQVKGIGVATAAGLIAFTGDLNRFKSFACFCSYFGLHVIDGKAPRRTPGKVANWHQMGRALILGIIAGCFVKQKGTETKEASEYRLIYEKEKERQLAIVDKPIIAEKRAKRKATKKFVKRFYYTYKRLSSMSDHEGGDKNLSIKSLSTAA